MAHSNSYSVTCWLRSAPVCSCQRRNQARPPPAAKWTGDCSQGSGGALTEAPAASRCVRFSTCRKRAAPAPLLPLPPGAENLPTLPRQRPVVAPQSPSRALPGRQTSGSFSLRDRKGPSLTSELQSSSSIFRLKQRAGVVGLAERCTRGRLAGECAPAAPVRGNLKSAGWGGRPSPPRPSSGRAPAA